jgi:hypothetical protein
MHWQNLKNFGILAVSGHNKSIGYDHVNGYEKNSASRLGPTMCDHHAFQFDVDKAYENHRWDRTEGGTPIGASHQGDTLKLT